MPDALGNDGVRIYALLLSEFGPATAELFVFCCDSAAKHGDAEARKDLRLASSFADWSRSQIEPKH